MRHFVACHSVNIMGEEYESGLMSFINLHFKFVVQPFGGTTNFFNS